MSFKEANMESSISANSVSEGNIGLHLTDWSTCNIRQRTDYCRMRDFEMRMIFLKLATLLALFSIIGCGCDDCTAKAIKYPAYTNKSGETVKIIATGGDFTSKIYEKLIINGDTLHHNVKELDIPELNNCGLAVNCDNPPTVRMELHFLEEPIKCLIFDGPIKNDGIDTRSIKSYKKGEEIYRADFWVDVEYIYTITPEIRAIAKEEYCQDSISE